METTELTELDVANVAPGDEVRVRFDALPDVVVGGTVERVALTSENRNGDIVYTARIALSEPVSELQAIRREVGAPVQRILGSGNLCRLILIPERRLYGKPIQMAALRVLFSFFVTLAV